MNTRPSLRLPTVTLGLLGMAGAHDALACSSCGCTLNADWASQGYHTGAGLRLDLRTDYYDQNQLRSGTDSVDRGTLALPNEKEIQLRTLNRNTLFTLDYSPTRLWGLQVQVPYFNRSHDTLLEGETDVTHSHSRSIGDVRVMARYQGLSPDLSWGLQAGLKLPTGSTDVHFASGPGTGELLDRGLQPGTGSTDALLGAYHFGTWGEKYGYSAQVILQQPLNTNKGFKVGTAVNFSAGLRVLFLPYVEPQLQMNVRVEGREQGAASDRDNSGGTFAYLSPGGTVFFNTHWQVYGFMQLPVYSQVNGLQLEPGRFYSMGVHYAY